MVLRLLLTSPVVMFGPDPADQDYGKTASRLRTTCLQKLITHPNWSVRQRQQAALSLLGLRHLLRSATLLATE